MSTPADPNSVISQQERTSVIAAISTPLRLSALVVLVLEALFLLELVKSEKYVPEDKRFWIIIALIGGVIVILAMSWLFTRKAEEIAVRAAREAAQEAARLAKKEYHFTGYVTGKKGAPIQGAIVTLWKNDQQVGPPKQTAMMGDTAFTVPVEEKDELKVRVEKAVAGVNESRERYILTAGYQHKFNVEF